MKAIIRFNNKTLEAHLNKSTIVDELYVMFTLETTPQYKRLKLDVHPKQDILLQSIEIQLDAPLDKNQSRIYCNGFLSSSESRLYNFDEIPDHLSAIAKPFLGNSGDYHFSFIPRKKGILHSWSYAYIQNNNLKEIDFIGSLNENTGFTCILYNADNQTVTIKKDVENLQLTHSYPAIDVVMYSRDNPFYLFPKFRNTPSVFETYFNLQNIKKPQNIPKENWTNFQKNATIFSENTIIEDLKLIAENKAELEFYTIHEGWTNHIGDWVSIKNTFPNGMAKMAQLIHNQGLKANLCLSPFVVEAESQIFKTKPDWILRSNGKPLKVGFSPSTLGWSQPYLYALDFYNKDVQEYLTGVFHTILDKWGYDMVQLDLLYAVCILPRPNKTRGQIMHDALAFLRQIVGNKMILAGDVPLASAYGLVDYCRVGSDKYSHRENQILKFLKYRERNSALSLLKFEK